MPGPDPNAPAVDPSSRAYISLITRGSYLPGLALLIHTLDKQESKHAIVVQYTESLEPDCVQCLRNLTSIYPLLHTQRVEPLALPKGLSPIAERFDATLTKLRAFAPLDCQKWAAEPPLSRIPEEVCFLDADIMIFRSVDEVFDIPRPDSNWITAHHACCCNIDSDPWAPAEWKPENCPLTPLRHPEALEAKVPASSADGARETYKALNSGVFVCTPSKELWSRMDHFRLHDERVKTFTFPDQNFLDVFFEDHWVPMPYTFNALKTHRYWHADAWRDEEVRALHYIVDKPWEARVAEDGTAGYKSRDGETHNWWWKEYDAWEKRMKKDGQQSVLECVQKYMCVDSGLGKTRFQGE
ncbi:nucleotide-diphospho-sugar transferase [Neohortaea acidophila]|uniref:Nucleotide-diphospho-sugar transferase n=1 Tax=Neohortaea acidophila TaxID=245834 RepID=A0A6A6PJR1_9PEZI|nr:nucleotide-diphospho-sugar transferase [Neohortaea acidophila]KAF2480308.1 nucleotide-diphospho-sugar transferase [Neohortaea acidophila]